ncbi:unnamed protein product [Linum trigynum]|uniref:Uncharacterized protein n=1 Tax=Linum trigynum TaxID=586398 RepID=A0AAV2FPP1_9ROSI
MSLRGPRKGKVEAAGRRGGAGEVGAWRGKGWWRWNVDDGPKGGGEWLRDRKGKVEAAGRRGGAGEVEAWRGKGWWRWNVDDGPKGEGEGLRDDGEQVKGELGGGGPSRLCLGLVTQQWEAASFMVKGEGGWLAG